MHKDFSPYAEAFELKQIGFDEPCFGLFTRPNNELLVKEMPDQHECELYFGGILAPTYSQAFRFFREKCGLHSYIEGAYPWFRYYINSHDNIWEGHKYLRHEEAELACLRKLIEIVKTKQ